MAIDALGRIIDVGSIIVYPGSRVTVNSPGIVTDSYRAKPVGLVAYAMKGIGLGDETVQKVHVITRGLKYSWSGRNLGSRMAIHLPSRSIIIGSVTPFQLTVLRTLGSIARESYSEYWNIHQKGGWQKTESPEYQAAKALMESDRDRYQKEFDKIVKEGKWQKTQ